MAFATPKKVANSKGPKISQYMGAAPDTFLPSKMTEVTRLHFTVFYLGEWAYVVVYSEVWCFRYILGVKISFRCLDVQQSVHRKNMKNTKKKQLPFNTAHLTSLTSLTNRDIHLSPNGQHIPHGPVQMSLAISSKTSTGVNAYLVCTQSRLGSLGN